MGRLDGKETRMVGVDGTTPLTFEGARTVREDLVRSSWVARKRRLKRAMERGLRVDDDGREQDMEPTMGAVCGGGGGSDHVVGFRLGGGGRVTVKVVEVELGRASVNWKHRR
jgi:hypothetical protein